MNKPFKTTMKPEMLLRKTLHKTKTFFNKTFQNLKSFLFGRYQKLPKLHFVNPFFSANNGSQRMQELDDFYRGFSEQRDANHDELQKRKSEVIAENAECCQSHPNRAEIRVPNKQKERPKEEEESEHHEGRREELFSHNSNGGSHSIVQKMKEFEMFELDDVDHQLDVEEVLHYYSRLTCPVYLDIVDKFFMDMYTEFFVPQPSVSINSSMRRLGPLKL